MNNTVLNFLKNNWLVPAIVISLMALGMVKWMDFSLTDYVADKVIEKLNADYTPYGPTTTVNANNTQVQNGSN